MCWLTLSGNARLAPDRLEVLHNTPDTALHRAAREAMLRIVALLAAVQTSMATDTSGKSMSSQIKVLQKRHTSGVAIEGVNCSRQDLSTMMAAAKARNEYAPSRPRVLVTGAAGFIGSHVAACRASASRSSRWTTCRAASRAT